MPNLFWLRPSPLFFSFMIIEKFWLIEWILLCLHVKFSKPQKISFKLCARESSRAISKEMEIDFRKKNERKMWNRRSKGCHRFLLTLSKHHHRIMLLCCVLGRLRRSQVFTFFTIFFSRSQSTDSFTLLQVSLDFLFGLLLFFLYIFFGISPNVPSLSHFSSYRYLYSESYVVWVSQKRKHFQTTYRRNIRETPRKWVKIKQKQRVRREEEKKKMKCKEEWELTCSITYFISLYAFKAPMMVFFFNNCDSTTPSRELEASLVRVGTTTTTSLRDVEKPIFHSLTQNALRNWDPIGALFWQVGRSRVWATLIHIFPVQSACERAQRSLSRSRVLPHNNFWTRFHVSQLYFPSTSSIFCRWRVDREMCDALKGARSAIWDAVERERAISSKMKPFELSKTAKNRIISGENRALEWVDDGWTIVGCLLLIEWRAQSSRRREKKSGIIFSFFIIRNFSILYLFTHFFLRARTHSLFCVVRGSHIRYSIAGFLVHVTLTGRAQ